MGPSLHWHVCSVSSAALRVRSTQVALLVGYRFWLSEPSQAQQAGSMGLCSAFPVALMSLCP